jgi:cytochrome c oxidase subunit 4
MSTETAAAVESGAGAADQALELANGAEVLPGEVRPHPTPLQYVLIAVVLCVITGIEIAVSYTEGDIPDGLIVTLLLGMAIIKFTLVASWYMHLRTDLLVFRRFFVMGIVAAIILFSIVLLSLHAI